MAKTIPKPPEIPTTVHSYRIERLNTYEHQGYILTKHSDGSFTELPFGKPTLVSLLVHKIGAALSKEANEVFQANKKLKA